MNATADRNMNRDLSAPANANISSKKKFFSLHLRWFRRSQLLDVLFHFLPLCFSRRLILAFVNCITVVELILCERQWSTKGGDRSRIVGLKGSSPPPWVLVLLTPGTKHVYIVVNHVNSETASWVHKFLRAKTSENREKRFHVAIIISAVTSYTIAARNSSA